MFACGLITGAIIMLAVVWIYSLLAVSANAGRRAELQQELKHRITGEDYDDSQSD